MGKNQQHKAMQQQRHSANADGEAVPDAGDGTVDVSFHSPEWHAARIAALTTERVSWEDFKKKQKAEASMAAAEAEVMQYALHWLPPECVAVLAPTSLTVHHRAPHY